jgi:hypothetical protein
VCPLPDLFKRKAQQRRHPQPQECIVLRSRLPRVGSPRHIDERPPLRERLPRPRRGPRLGDDDVARLVAVDQPAQVQRAVRRIVGEVALYIGQLAAQRRLDILPGRGGIVLCRVGAEVDGEGVLPPCVCYRVWYNQAAGGDGWART